MKALSIIYSIALIAAMLAGGAARAEFETPVIKEWTVIEKDKDGKDKEVAYMTIDGIQVHESDPAKQPQPEVVTPGARLGDAPSDAIVLFDGTDLSQWTSTKEGEETKWVLTGGLLSPTKKSGYIRTKEEFGSCQLHLEFATPAEVKGDSQGRGNSGVFLMGQYEVQILDSYDNHTYPDGQAAALYGRSKPLVNASRKPGQWQTYDIIFHRPIFKGEEVVKRATFTILHNGVLVQNHRVLSGGTGWRGSHSISEYKPHADTGPIQLQDHGNPVLFRNIWIRPLDD